MPNVSKRETSVAIPLRDCAQVRTVHTSILFVIIFVYLADDYPNYKDESAPEQTQHESNNVNMNGNEVPYFRLSAYTEKVKVGETAELKCEAKNTASKFAPPKTIWWVIWFQKKKNSLTIFIRRWQHIHLVQEHSHANVVYG